MKPKVFNFVNIMHTNDPEKIDNLAVYLAWIKTMHMAYNATCGGSAWVELYGTEFP